MRVTPEDYQLGTINYQGSHKPLYSKWGRLRRKKGYAQNFADFEQEVIGIIHTHDSLQSVMDVTTEGLVLDWTKKKGLYFRPSKKAKKEGKSHPMYSRWYNYWKKFMDFPDFLAALQSACHAQGISLEEDDISIRRSGKKLTVSKKLPFAATDPNGKVHVGTSQVRFSQKHGLTTSAVWRCLQGHAQSTKGWTGFHFIKDAVPVDAVPVKTKSSTPQERRPEAARPARVRTTHEFEGGCSVTMTSDPSISGWDIKVTCQVKIPSKILGDVSQEPTFQIVLNNPTRPKKGLRKSGIVEA